MFVVTADSIASTLLVHDLCTVQSVPARVGEPSRIRGKTATAARARAAAVALLLPGGGVPLLLLERRPLREGETPAMTRRLRPSHGASWWLLPRSAPALTAGGREPVGGSAARRSGTWTAHNHAGTASTAA
jgi:hypothetical protein